MRHYRLDVELVTEEIITGKAITTRIKDKQEFIVIDVRSEDPDKGTEQEIRLDTVKSITALDKNAEFGMIAIN